MLALNGGVTKVEPSRSKKVRATFHISEELLDEARNAVVALSGPPHRLSLAALVESALRNELDRLRLERTGRQRGRRFPPREQELRPGRPIA